MPVQLHPENRALDIHGIAKPEPICVRNWAAGFRRRTSTTGRELSFTPYLLRMSASLGSPGGSCQSETGQFGGQGPGQTGGSLGWPDCFVASTPGPQIF